MPPMLQLGKFYHENLTIEKVDEILDLCSEGQVDLAKINLNKIAVS